VSGGTVDEPPGRKAAPLLHRLGDAAVPPSSPSLRWSACRLSDSTGRRRELPDVLLIWLPSARLSQLDGPCGTSSGDAAPELCGALDLLNGPDVGTFDAQIHIHRGRDLRWPDKRGGGSRIRVVSVTLLHATYFAYYAIVPFPAVFFLLRQTSARARRWSSW
jgi:hypothetical protein